MLHEMLKNKLCVSVCMCACVAGYITAVIWKSENLWESVLSFNYPGPRNKTYCQTYQTIPLLGEPFPWPLSFSFLFETVSHYVGKTI